MIIKRRREIMIYSLYKKGYKIIIEIELIKVVLLVNCKQQKLLVKVINNQVANILMIKLQKLLRIMIVIKG